MTNIEDEIHNIQSVIDSISMDLLHEDLSHLTGESMVFGYNSNNNNNKSKAGRGGGGGADLVSIEYLLDIIRSLNEWISSRIESRVDETTVQEEVVQGESLSHQLKLPLNPQPPQPVQAVSVCTTATSPLMPTASLQHFISNNNHDEYQNREEIYQQFSKNKKVI